VTIRVIPAKAGIQFLATVTFAVASSAASAQATFTTKSLTPETALKAAQAALAQCRKDGFQVTVAVVDRAGLTQALIRDRFAGPHTLDVAQNKAWSAVSFKTSTTDLERVTRPGTTMSGLRHVPRAMVVGGGLTIEAGGSLMGAIGVSGAPGGDADETCAKAGIKAVADDLEF
jgi:uncharacterized protein GlcG (DUF336 family)